jgi:uncharacterized membrane protein YqaE (UPF0057 family)
MFWHVLVSSCHGLRSHQLWLCLWRSCNRVIRPNYLDLRSGDTIHHHTLRNTASTVTLQLQKPTYSNNRHHVRFRLLFDASLRPLPTRWRYVAPTAAAPGSCIAYDICPHVLTHRAVWVKKGICSADSLINLALCCLGFLPGLLHAWYVILQNPDPYDGYNQVADGERGDGRTTYYVITHDQPAGRGGQQNYGTVGSQPSNGQFPGQQSGVTNQHKQNKKAIAPAPQQSQSGQGSSSQPEGPPPTYADVIKGDHKVQKP